MAYTGWIPCLIGLSSIFDLILSLIVLGVPKTSDVNAGASQGGSLQADEVSQIHIIKLKTQELKTCTIY